MEGCRVYQSETRMTDGRRSTELTNGSRVEPRGARSVQRVGCSHSDVDFRQTTHLEAAWDVEGHDRVDVRDARLDDAELQDENNENQNAETEVGHSDRATLIPHRAVQKIRRIICFDGREAGDRLQNEIGREQQTLEKVDECPVDKRWWRGW